MELTYTPWVATYLFSNQPVMCLFTKVVLPTPPSPMRTTLNSATFLGFYIERCFTSIFNSVIVNIINSQIKNSQLYLIFDQFRHSQLYPIIYMKPFKNLKTVEKSSKYMHLKQIAQMTLGSGNMSLAVELPSGEDLNEWLAVNAIEFYNEISILYGTLTQFCTKDSCPVMSAGQKFQYLWADGQNVKTPLKVPAPEYIELLMTWVENQFNSESLFPCQIGVPFPKNFLTMIKTIFKRLFRVYAHIYHTHFQIIMALGLEYHLNTCFKHFIFFIDEFKLVEDKELAPLSELIQQFKLRKQG